MKEVTTEGVVVESISSKDPTDDKDLLPFIPEVDELFEESRLKEEKIFEEIHSK